ncbi:MAG: hypothetical protein K0U38_06280, partial [Epsilonproteobacteria bacterium]|nr:hypothetical protein [Campylobacterota bacterium]
MRFQHFYLMLPIVLLFSACMVPTNPSPALNLNTTVQEQPLPSLQFQTNQSRFLTPLSEVKNSVEKRNSFIDEFIFQSDMQCQYHLSHPIQNEPQTSQERSLYMSMFDTVSFLFGTKYITDVAKQAFNSDTAQSQADKDAYKNALTPEIRQGVKIARAKYAQKMMAQKESLFEVYGLDALQKDMMNYDKQCSEEYGLIEINRALKQAQFQMMQPTQGKPTIDPKEIKKKVEAVKFLP